MITFTIDSGLVHIWGDAVISGEKTLEQVPAISNLRTIVAQYVAEKG